MAEWDAGYVTAIDYTFGYFPSLNPRRHRLPLLKAGFAPPGTATACELGFGQGLSLAIHTAASPTRWCGTDFSPAHADQAHAFAAAAAAGIGDVAWYDEDFARFCARAELPAFDFIGLHGVWSWISDENRMVIVEFIRRHLKVGGVLYLSYNTQPGWAAMVPMRQLLALHTQRLGGPGQALATRIDDAIDFAEGLLAVAPALASDQPRLAAWVQGLRPQSRHYLAHEYFNRDWQPMLFAEVAEWLGAARLTFAATASSGDTFAELTLTPEQRQFLAAIPDPTLRETSRDFLLNRQFRGDYWNKGGRRLPPVEQEAALREESFVLARRRQDVSLTVSVAGGEAQLNQAVYEPLLDALADHRPWTLGEIERRVGGERLPLVKLVEAATVLVAAGVLAPALAAAETASCRTVTGRLNRYLLKRAPDGGDIEHLASPVTGGGIFVPRLQQLFLLAGSGGHKTPEAWAAFAWEQLSVRGEQLQTAGGPLTTAEEHLAELTRLARAFAEKGLPILRALGVVEETSGPEVAAPGLALEASFSPTSAWGRSWPP